MDASSLNKHSNILSLLSYFVWHIRYLWILCWHSVYWNKLNGKSHAACWRNLVTKRIRQHCLKLWSLWQFDLYIHPLICICRVNTCFCTKLDLVDLVVAFGKYHFSPLVQVVLWILQLNACSISWPLTGYSGALGTTNGHIFIWVIISTSSYFWAWNCLTNLPSILWYIHRHVLHFITTCYHLACTHVAI